MAATTDLSPPVNHVFVDFENVHKIDLAVIGRNAVTFTLLVGPQQKKLDVSLVEKLFEHAASVELVRLIASGRNALDFALAYYLGRGVAADPAGYFHIVSKDTGYDPLVQQLRGKRIKVRRHDSFDSLTFEDAAVPTAHSPPAAVPKLKAPSKPKAQSSILDQRATKVLEHLRTLSRTRPRNEKRLVSYLVNYLGRTITETQALNLVEKLRQAGHIAVDEKGRVTYV